MHFSYWEYKQWFQHVDYTVVGSGIVGLSTALAIKEVQPSASILILEKGNLPEGASTKNAGFACFGSVSELLMDLDTHSEEELIELVKRRYNGINALRAMFGDNAIGFKQLGGHEVFLKKDKDLFERCKDRVAYLNTLFHEVFVQEVFSLTPNKFGFSGIEDHYITHSLEGQLDTGKLMQALLKKAHKSGIKIINGLKVLGFDVIENQVSVLLENFDFKTKKLLITNNGFAKQLTEQAVEPARAQVLITKPIKDLQIKGTFHLDAGYYYFRNIDNRILLGGGRNLDFEGESTTQLGNTEQIISKLKLLLHQTILSNTPFEVDYTWSGIMGVGPCKKPIIKELTKNVFCGVRLGGMGIAIGAAVGQDLANKVLRT